MCYPREPNGLKWGWGFAPWRLVTLVMCTLPICVDDILRTCYYKNGREKGGPVATISLSLTKAEFRRAIEVFQHEGKSPKEIESFFQDFLINLETEASLPFHIEYQLLIEEMSPIRLDDPDSKNILLGIQSSAC